MDEIEYKLCSNNSVLIVNAVEKLVTTIKLKYKPAERQKFVLENSELNFLKEKCSSKDILVSSTSFQGLLALVELGVLDIAQTMSTVIAFLATSQNYSAIVSTISGLLVLELKCRLTPTLEYECQYALKSQQHPFITILEKNIEATDVVLNQMQSLCTSCDNIVQSNSMKLLRPVFLWLLCNSESKFSTKAWSLLLSQDDVHDEALIIECLCWQKIRTAKQAEASLVSYSLALEAAVKQKNNDLVVVLLPLLTRLSHSFINHGLDPRSCYTLINKYIEQDISGINKIIDLIVVLLSENVSISSAVNLEELFNLCEKITSKHKCLSLSINILTSQLLQWLQLPSIITDKALKMAATILNTKKDRIHSKTNFNISNGCKRLLMTDNVIEKYCLILKTYTELIDTDLIKWIDKVISINSVQLLEIKNFVYGMFLEGDDAVSLVCLNRLLRLIDERKDIADGFMPVLLHKISNVKSARVKMECLRALPLMAKSKVNVPIIVSILLKLKQQNTLPTSFLIKLLTTLFEVQSRCFPYLHESLIDYNYKTDDSKWEVEVARSHAVRTVCEVRPASGTDLIGVVSSTLNRCTDSEGATACAIAIQSLLPLWQSQSVSPISTWKVLEPKLSKDMRCSVQVSTCKLLSEIPSLYIQNDEYDKLMESSAGRLWKYISEGHEPQTVIAACEALAQYTITQYTLKVVPEIYKTTVKLPSPFCKTPEDAARRPDDVLDYIPCEIWPELFKNTNYSAFSGVRHLVSTLIGAELRSYRSGVYQRSERGEPPNLSYLPPHSVVRGMADFLKKQATSPTYDCPDIVLLEILNTLNTDYCKPLPPFDVCFVHDLFHRSNLWRSPCLSLAAKQAQLSLSAKRFLDNYLATYDPSSVEPTEIVTLFEILPQLCKNMPPNSLRCAIDKCLEMSINQSIDIDGVQLSIKLFELMGVCLEANIHETNRTLLEQILEAYFELIAESHVAFPTYVKAVIKSKELDKLSSPLSWWEVTGTVVRKSLVIRTQMVKEKHLDCLIEMIDCVAEVESEHNFALSTLWEAFLIVEPDAHTRDWMLSYMAKTQIAFTDSKEESAKLFYCDVFIISVIIYSGVWAFVYESQRHLCSNRELRMSLFPNALAMLFSLDLWKDYVPRICGWLSHPTVSRYNKEMQTSCRNALIAMKNSDKFTIESMWSVLST